MPLPSVTGELTGAVNNLAASLAACAQFQSLVGAADSAAALNHIYFSALPPPASGGKHTKAEIEGYRPYALIYLDEETGCTFEADAGGEQDYFGRRLGKLHLWIEQNVPALYADDPSTADAEFLEIIDTLVGQLLDLSGIAGYMSFARLTTEGPMRAPEDVSPTLGDYQVCKLHVEYVGGA